MLDTHLEKLKGFYAVAVTGSFSRAAARERLTQPALTRTVRSLEEVCGTQLLLRHPRGATLTAAGRVLADYCEKLFAELPDLERRLRAPSSLSGVVYVGSYETLGLSFWPRALRDLARELPEIDVRITTRDPDALWRKLENGVLDLIVDAEPPSRESLYSRVLLTDEFGLFVRPSARDALLAREVLPLSYVQRATDRDGFTIAEALAKREIGHVPVYDFDTFISVKAATLEGLCVGVLPLTLVATEVRAGRLKEIAVGGRKHRFGAHRICATCLESRRKDARLQKILRLLAREAQS